MTHSSFLSFFLPSPLLYAPSLTYKPHEQASLSSLFPSHAHAYIIYAHAYIIDVKKHDGHKTNNYTNSSLSSSPLSSHPSVPPNGRGSSIPTPRFSSHQSYRTCLSP